MPQVTTLKAALEALPLKPRLILTTPPPRTDASNTAPISDYTERKALDATIGAKNRDR
jgi:hypothetical protein